MHLNRWFSRLCVALLLVLSSAPAVALAQQAPTVSSAPKQNRWIPLVIAIVLVGGALVGSFISSRRGHRD